MDKIYFNPETGGFHHEKVDGPRQIAAPQSAAEIKAKKRPVMIANPDCRVPVTAIEISQSQFRALMEAQATGKRIEVKDGSPVATDPEPDAEQYRNSRRVERNRKLAASDWTQLPDAPLPASLKKAWADYRTALRDLALDGSDWPSEPEVAA